MNARTSLETLDELIRHLDRLIHQHRDPLRPGRTARIEHELRGLVDLRTLMTPPPLFRVARDESLAPDESVLSKDGVTALGRFAWSRLMRQVNAPWPEEALTPDQDFPRDAPP